MSKLAIEGVGRTFPGVRGGAPTVALQPITLAVEDNDFITILGPSGCGKSTLLRIVAGLDTPTTGRVVLDGTPVTAPGADRGMVFQSYTLFPWLTVRENICFGLREKSDAAGASRTRSPRTTSPASDSPASSITIRRCSRAACSSAPRSPARSPTIRRSCCSTSRSARSTTRRAALMQELLLGIWEAEKKTVLFVTHDIEEAIFMAGRVVVMSARPGRIKAEVAVDLPHPRLYTVKTTPEFSALKARLTEEIRVEALKVAVAA